MAYAEIFEAFPAELRFPIARLVDTLREELGTSRADIAELKTIVRDLAQAQTRTEGRLEELAQAQTRTEGRLEELAQAQQRTELRMERLEGAVQELAQAQARTEIRLEELAQAQVRTEIRLEELAQAQARTEIRLEELAQAQVRTEIRLEELAQAQARTEIRLEELAQAQQRTELRMDRLEAAVHELAQAQQRSEISIQQLGEAVRALTETQIQFQRTFTIQIGGLGARWGMQTEEAFRQGMRTILQEVGFTTERFLDYDAAGEVFGHPDQVELDVVIKDGRVIVVEIKSALDTGNTYLFDRKVAFYTRKTGRQVDRRLIVTPYADNRAREVGLRLGIEICTDVTTLR